MTGNTLQIFSIFMVFTLFKSPVMAVLGLQRTFAPYETPGTSGRFTFEYVGGGYWQRTSEGAAAIAGNLEAFAYGLPTSASAVPRTGQAVYSVDLLGAVTVPNNVQGFTGAGKLLVNFASGTISIRGSIPCSRGTPCSPRPRGSASGSSRASRRVKAPVARQRSCCQAGRARLRWQ